MDELKRLRAENATLKAEAKAADARAEAQARAEAKAKAETKAARAETANLRAYLRKSAEEHARKLAELRWNSHPHSFQR